MTRAQRNTKIFSALAALALIGVGAGSACGGGRSGGGTGPSGGAGGGAGDMGLDTDPSGLGADIADAGVPDAAPPPAPVTFVLVNKSPDQDLVFSLDKGWQPVITAYSGQPPKAKPILMFATHCTASCDTPPEERCPHCPAPEKVKDIKEAERREVVPPGGELEVPWDAQVYVYEKSKGTRNGKNVRCECYQVQEVPAETYTVRAFGLRLTTSAEESTKITMATSTMTLPAEDGEPIRVVLEFEPEKKAPEKKKKK